MTNICKEFNKYIKDKYYFYDLPKKVQKEYIFDISSLTKYQKEEREKFLTTLPLVKLPKGTILNHYTLRGERDKYGSYTIDINKILSNPKEYFWWTSSLPNNEGNYFTLPKTKAFEIIYFEYGFVKLSYCLKKDLYLFYIGDIKQEFTSSEQEYIIARMFYLCLNGQFKELFKFLDEKGFIKEYLYEEFKSLCYTPKKDFHQEEGMGYPKNEIYLLLEDQIIYDISNYYNNRIDNSYGFSGNAFRRISPSFPEVEHRGYALGLMKRMNELLLPGFISLDHCEIVISSHFIDSIFDINKLKVKFFKNHHDLKYEGLTPEERKLLNKKRKKFRKEKDNKQLKEEIVKLNLIEKERFDKVFRKIIKEEKKLRT